MVAAGAILLGLVIGVLFSRHHRAAKPKDVAVPAAAPPPGTGRPLRLLRAEVSTQPDLLGVVEGNVLSGLDGQAVSGATVTFLHAGQAFSATCDASGTFRLEELRPGAYQLQNVSAKGYLPLSPNSARLTLSVGAGTRIRDLTLFLLPTENYVGRVLDPDDRRLANVTVRRLDAPEGEPDRFVSDQNGEFHFSAEKFAMFEARHPKYRTIYAVVDNSAWAGRTLYLRFRDWEHERARGVVSGTVTDAEHHPLLDVHVAAMRTDRTTQFGDPTVANALTDVEGKFVLPDLEEGATYRVAAASPGFADDARVAHTGDALQLILSQSTPLRGRVVDSDGKPVTTFTLVASLRRGALARGAQSTATFVDAQGRFEWTELARGGYWLQALVHGRAPSKELAVDLADAPVEVTLEITRGTRIFGKIIDTKSQAPLERAQVTFESIAASPTLSSAVTGADGAFSLDGVPQGRQSIVVTALGHHGRMVTGLESVADHDLGPITVDLQPTEPGEEPTLEFAGVGAVLHSEADSLVVTQLLPGGGAEAAGVQIGDAALLIDGIAAAQLGFRGAIERLRGPEGTTVQVLFRRGPEGGSREVLLSLERRRLRPPPQK
jgi:hypothetical protein